MMSINSGLLWDNPSSKPNVLCVKKNININNTGKDAGSPFCLSTFRPAISAGEIVRKCSRRIMHTNGRRYQTLPKIYIAIRNDFSIKDLF